MSMSASGQIHTLASSQVCDRLRSRVQGLDEAEVLERRRACGLNEIRTESRWRLARLLLRHLINFFSLLLYVSAAVCLIAERLQPGEGMQVLAWALAGVALLNTLFAFAQEVRSDRAMQALRQYLPQSARVRRAGSERQLPVIELVPGDILLLGEGDRVAADCRLIQSEALLLNSAPLTGESRSIAITSSPATGDLIDSPNIAFAGCSVLRGGGVGVVFATGHQTQFGRIATLSREVRRSPSPIERETNRMIRILTVIAVSLGLLFFAYGMVSGRSLWVNIVFMLGIIVANVPEGLLPTFTLAMSMASLRMAKRQVLVKSLEAVESLGAMHIICTDKTGTLTTNELSITKLVEPVSGAELDAPPAKRRLLMSALIASEVRPRGDDWLGDPLDVAVARCYVLHCGSPSDVILGTRRHFPFDLQKRRQAGVFADASEVLFAVKGAWESLRPLIGFRESWDTEALQGLPMSMDAAALLNCDAIVQRLSLQGQRVIAVASRRLPELASINAQQESIEQSLVLQGFIALEDPIRDDVPNAVAKCQQAGIRVVMITGDHPDTAQAIARRCGILAAETTEPAQTILHGKQLAELTESQLAERIQGGVRVFARTTPEQKLKIVRAIKQAGLVVGMTGDGVNDSPALKAADVGIAMGLSGTEVARESADIVLLDDSFASIVAGVEEGRGVFANMQKFTTYVLASNIPEIVPFLIFVIFPVPLALTVIQILTIDLGTDLLPAIGLGQEPPEGDVMRVPPRRANDRLLSRAVIGTAYLFVGMIEAAWSLAMFFLVLVQGGWHWGQELSSGDPLARSATGITLASVLLLQIGNVISRRSTSTSGINLGLLRNKLLVLGIAIEIIFSWAVLYFPPVQAILNTGPVAWPIYVLAWLGIPILLGLDWLRKSLARRTHLSQF